MKILLDANFLVYCVKQKIDYISEMPVSGEITVLSSVVAELEKLRKVAEKASDKKDADIALQILKKNLEKKNLKVLETSEKDGDEAIIKNLSDGDIVATMDKELKKELKGKVRILTIKGGKKLEVL